MRHSDCLAWNRASCGLSIRLIGRVNERVNLNPRRWQLRSAGEGYPMWGPSPTGRYPNEGPRRSSSQLQVLAVALVAAMAGVVAMVDPLVAGAVVHPATVTVPGAPRGVRVAPGNRAAVIKWTAPANDGGRPITGYVATASPGSQTCSTTGATINTCSVHGLVNGHAYSVSVRASNKKGLGAPSAGVTVKPGIPLAPTHVKATPGNADATVFWTAPANNGSRITKYTVTTTPSFKRCTTAGAKAWTVTGLANETTYRFKVTATNAFGTGVPSAPSAPATPPVVQTIAVGQSPKGISSDGAYIWVTNATSGSVTELNASNGSVVHPSISVGKDPEGIVSDGTHVWVANTSLGSVAELNASDGSNVRTTPVGTDPEGISSDGAYVWVANSGSNSVSELNAADGALLRTIAVGANPGSVSLDGTHVWLTNDADGTVTELNASTGAFVETIAVGTNPDAISSDGTDVWVANKGGNSVTELDASTGSIVQTVPVGATPDAVTSDGTHVWVANSGSRSVTELNASTGSIAQTISVGTTPDAVTSDGSHVWVANSGSNSVTEIAV